MKCPRCRDDRDLAEDGTCDGCHGQLLAQAAAERLLHDELGHDVEKLRRLAEMFGGHPLRCPACGGAQSPLELKGVPVDLCLGCGAVWLDDGEERVLRDRAQGVLTKLPPRPRPAPAPAPGPVTPTRVGLRETITDTPAWLAWLGFLVGAVGTATLLSATWWALRSGEWRALAMLGLLDIGALSFCAHIARRVRVVVDPERQVVEHSTGYLLLTHHDVVPVAAVRKIRHVARLRSWTAGASAFRVRLVIDHAVGATEGMPFALDPAAAARLADAIARATGAEVDQRLALLGDGDD